MSERSSDDVAVSVIIRTYNRGYCLGRAIESVLHQTFGDWELLIVDNHSTDNTAELVASYQHPGIKYLQIQNHGIIAASINLALRHAKGAYIAILDSDDWWMPEKLELSLQALRRGADLVYHDLYLLREGELRPKLWRKTKTRRLKPPVFDDLLHNGNAINNSSVVVRRELLEKTGGFSEDRRLIAAEDYDTWLRMAKSSDAFSRLPWCLGYYAVGADNLSSAERTTINVQRLIELYGSEIRQNGGGIPAWMSYSLCSAHYKCGAYAASIENSLKVIRSPIAPFLFFCKASILFFMAACRRLVKR